jgi:hypothetical protein
VKPESTFGNIFEDFEKVMMSRYKIPEKFQEKSSRCMQRLSNIL